MVGNARLYSADTGARAVGDALGRYTYLRVLGGGGSRLQVEVTNERGQAGARGWVDPPPGTKSSEYPTCFATPLNVYTPFTRDWAIFASS